MTRLEYLLWPVALKKIYEIKYGVKPATETEEATDGN